MILNYITLYYITLHYITGGIYYRWDILQVGYTAGVLMIFIVALMIVALMIVTMMTMYVCM